MPLITVTAGRYAGTYAASNYGQTLDMGITNDNGYELSWVTHQEEVRGTDAYGRTLLDTVYHGADWRLRAMFKEYRQANMNAAWAWGRGANVALYPIMGVIARLGSGLGHAIALTAASGTPAASNPATLTASSVITQPGANAHINFTSKVREVPVELSLLPYDLGGGTPGWFTVT